jgi:GNAT superfamily N-acetyltransferase
MIRPATRADIPDIVDLGVRHLRDSHYAAFIEPDRDHMAAFARMLIDAPCALLLVAEQAGAVIGAIGVMATPHPYSGQPVMSEMFWYVAPEARGSGVKLLKAAEVWGRQIGVRHSIMIAPDSRVSTFLQRMGYARLEEQFIKAL